MRRIIRYHSLLAKRLAYLAHLVLAHLTLVKQTEAVALLVVILVVKVVEIVHRVECSHVLCKLLILLLLIIIITHKFVAPYLLFQVMSTLKPNQTHLLLLVMMIT